MLVRLTAAGRRRLTGKGIVDVVACAARHRRLVQEIQPRAGHTQIGP